MFRFIRINLMNLFGFILATISHSLKDPHSKSLEPDCLSPSLAITTQSLKRGKAEL